jgi:DNA polymerase III subunit delta'
MRFEEVLGQEPIKQQLQELVLQNRLSHAMLLIGKEGSGLLPLALAFTSFLVAHYEKKEAPAASVALDMFGEPIASVTAPSIGQGASMAQEYIHPDVHYSFPVVPKKTGDKPISTDYINEFRTFIKEQPYGNVYDWLQHIAADNKQGNITAAECADIIRKLYLKTYLSEYKVLVMWMPEYLHEQGNKLLKLIEEPPPNTLFLLLCEDESRLLSTIVSRCQTIYVPPIANETIAEQLHTQYELPKTVAQKIAALCEGNYREALQLLQGVEDNWHDILRNWLNSIVKNGMRIGLINTIDEIAKMGRERQKQLLKYFGHQVHQSLRLLYQENLAQILPAQELKFTQSLLSRCGPEGLQALMEQIDEATYHIERNVNGKICFLALSIKIKTILHDKHITLTQ